MDSWAKSTIRGRILSNILQIIAIVIMAKWGIEIDKETMAIAYDTTALVLTALFSTGGVVTVLISKWRERKVLGACQK
jgi:hypothetical protein